LRCDIGTLFNPVILSGTLSCGKANDKVESKDPYVYQHRPQQTPGVPHSCASFAQEPALSGVEGVGTTLIAQWALPFTPRVP